MTASASPSAKAGVPSAQVWSPASKGKKRNIAGASPVHLNR
jgi:hypothetical protein